MLQLTGDPQTFQNIHPQFVKKIGGCQKHAKALGLSELLQENFMPCNGKGESPMSAGQSGKQKRLKGFRLEAVRAGFKKAWQERDYAAIIAVARRMPEKILQEYPSTTRR